MTEIHVQNGYVVVEQSPAPEGRKVSLVFSYAEVDKLREDLLRAQMKIKDAAKVVFVKEEK